MTHSMEELYQKRMERYTTAMRNERPDQVPIRPFVAEFVAKYTGLSNADVTLDYELTFEATRKCAREFDWDATVGNLIWNWAGFIKTATWNSFAFPGIELEIDGAAQYKEPSEENAYMRADEYDQLIDDPTGFLFNVWLPRFTDHVQPPGGAVTLQHNLALLNGGLSLMTYNNANAKQAQLLRTECGTVPAISGLLKAPLDILSDKLRGYIGLSYDLIEQPDKVLQACEALMPHLLTFALAGADPNKQVPITIWMHRGCVPFVAPDHFKNMYWPTLRPIVEEIWSKGHQVLFYAEGNWDAHLESFAELPERSIVYHVDRGNIFKAHKILGEKFCLSGGIPNDLLTFANPAQVREYCKKVIHEAARDGGYIMDAAGIIQDDAKIENVQAMTDAAREYGIYSQASNSTPKSQMPPFTMGQSVLEREGQKRRPGVCIPWDEKKNDFPAIKGDESKVRKMWESQDALGYYFIWQCFMW